MPLTLKLLKVSVCPTFRSDTKSFKVPSRTLSSATVLAPVVATGGSLITMVNVPVAVVLPEAVEEVRSRTT